ncbi:neutral zinc metallopeptidase [Flavobacterium sp.]|uniref:KPN_02809 family neutral zinc metallopeptidase n=1 Tax=Flavobacterium sp. TaxID=239 RepID=UPI00121F2539|nr:neutral zinc metallopeptidase [Flavobacterium sp.]RZJ72977.1 MAG: metalloprotease [Flavobacterium sp.]
MKWLGRSGSGGNLEDRRGMSGGKLAAGGGLIAVIVVIAQLFLGGDGDTGKIIDVIQKQTVQTPSQQRELTAEEKKIGEMVDVILGDTEQVWKQIFSENDMTYKEPNLVLFTDAVETACGNATASVGPFYCPTDQKVYMDMAFFNELQTRFGAKGGDFAIAYVIAHEIGHHVQTLLGTSQKVREMQQGMSEAQANKLSVALELQADFYAGLWAHYNEKRVKMLEPGDIEEAMSAAEAVGDDAIQKRVRGQVVPDSFTHGTSAQRMKWFMKGFESGDIQQGDTFNGI